MPLLAFVINLVILCVVLAVVYVIVQAVLGYLAVPWAALALKVIGLLCLLVVALYILDALVGAGPIRWR